MGDTTSAVFYVAPLTLESVVVKAPKDGDPPPVMPAVTATYDESSWQLRVDFEPGLAAGEEVLLEVTMSGVFSIGFTWPTLVGDTRAAPARPCSTMI